MVSVGLKWIARISGFTDSGHRDPKRTSIKKKSRNTREFYILFKGLIGTRSIIRQVNSSCTKYYTLLQKMEHVPSVVRDSLHMYAYNGCTWETKILHT